MKKFRIILNAALAVLLAFASVSCTSTEANETSELNMADAGNVSATELPAKVTLDEVEKLLAAAREAYEKNDSVVLNDETVVFTNTAKPELTVQKVNEISDPYDQQFTDYRNYLINIEAIFAEMLRERFPEDSVYTVGGGNLPEMEYFFLDLEEDGFENAEAAVNKMCEDKTFDFDQVTDLVFTVRNTVYFYDAETDTETQIFPSPEEAEILTAIIARHTAAASDPYYGIDISKSVFN